MIAREKKHRDMGCEYHSDDVCIHCSLVYFQAFKLVKGKTWPLIGILCLFSMLISAFLDNVTTLLLLAPITIR